MADDPGVMGNLPRSRPGRRSEKRGGAAGSRGSKKPAAAEVKPTSAKSTRASSKPRAAAKPRATAAKPRASAKPRTAAKPAGAARQDAPRTAVRDERVEERGGQDPITAALRAGMAVGDAGVKVLSKIVQRLPRP